jgi:hypothetical protein
MTKWEPKIPSLYSSPYESNKIQDFLKEEVIYSRKIKIIHPIKSPIGNFNSTVDMENKAYFLTENEFII